MVFGQYAVAAAAHVHGIITSLSKRLASHRAAVLVELGYRPGALHRPRCARPSC